MKITNKKQLLLWRAEQRNGNITPVRASWGKSFTRENGELVLYFNDESGSTDRLPFSKIEEDIKCSETTET